MAGQGSGEGVPRAAASAASAPGAAAAEPEPLAHLQALIARLRGALAALQKAKDFITARGYWQKRIHELCTNKHRLL